MIKGLTYVAVLSQDVSRARRFFTEQLGLATEDDEGDEFGQFTTRDGSMWAVMQPLPISNPGGVDLYLRVEDVDGAYRAWRERGVEMVTEPNDQPFGRTFAFKDPDGRVMHAYTRPQA